MSPLVITLLVAAAGAVTWLVRAWFWPYTRSGKPVRGSKVLRRLRRGRGRDA